jgi:acetate kinase
MPEKIIFAHLGGGSSLTAVRNGKSIANTMGLTPISGLMMTTRVGDVDSDLDKILAQKMEKPINLVSGILSQKSGFLGLTGLTDTKEIFDRARAEEEKETGEFKREKLAFDIYLNQLIEKISGYIGLLEGINLLVFSGGIGEGNSYLRKKILKRLEFFGLTKEKVLALKVDEEGLIFNRMGKKD